MVKKFISVLLLEDVSKLGFQGNIAKVPLGYARNFLVPKGIACLVTPSIQKKVELDILNKEKKEALLIDEAKNIAEMLNNIKTFSIKKTVGKDNLIFGSVTTQEINEVINKITKQTIQKKNIEMPIIKTIGMYNIKIKLYKDIYSYIELQILPENE
uniref:ribosomal protein L9 n=1 Tax=Madagascaria erythrocladioides TaxID=753684 RepID=UPI001BF0D97F|nr:ribosomal protein L9 [Madagascaria erythrocladioides]QUE29077.1 ribosomal protein L9 [Madagascaria erythrocladioides]UNJ16633.1 ribosomal protein L9 [Madagascaria erythrocladioides]